MSNRIEVSSYNTQAGNFRGQPVMHAFGNFGKDANGIGRFSFFAAVLTEHAHVPENEIGESHIIRLHVWGMRGLVANFTWNNRWEKEPADEEASKAVEEIVACLFPMLQGFLTSSAPVGTGYLWSQRNRR
jgi:hypothetical protein